MDKIQFDPLQLHDYVDAKGMQRVIRSLRPVLLQPQWGVLRTARPDSKLDSSRFGTLIRFTYKEITINVEERAEEY